MPTQAKADQIDEIAARLQEATACWYVDARGLTVSETQQLRRNIREAGAEMKVYKNKLAIRALNQCELPSCEDILAGPTAFIFTGDDVAAPAKAIKDFAKENANLEIKGGLMEGKVLTPAEVEAVAALPTKDQLMGQIAGMLAGVARGLAVTINGVPSGLAQVVKAVADTKAA